MKFSEFEVTEFMYINLRNSLFIGHSTNWVPENEQR